MWFKKKAYISGFNTNIAVDGTDWRTNGTANAWPPSQTLPSAADAGNYFYLPALGHYYNGRQDFIGSRGNYWSSSTNPGVSSGAAYNLHFSSSFVAINSSGSSLGCTVGTFE